MKKLAHMINVVEDKPGNPSYHNIAQPITIESMVRAKKYAKSVDVELYSVQAGHEKQRELPPEFTVLPPLLKDVTHFKDFKDPIKRLPRIYDILLSLYIHSDAQWFVYTNVDIGVHPHFYGRLLDIINKGHDAACINRRDIPKRHKGVESTLENLDQIYKMPGQHHGGKDCFLFPRAMFPKFNFRNMVIGYPPIGTQIRDEIKRHSRNFLWIRNGCQDRLTFHIGRDEDWRKGSKWDRGNLVRPAGGGALAHNLGEQKFIEKHYKHSRDSTYNQFIEEGEGKISPGRELNPRWKELAEKYGYNK